MFGYGYEEESGKDVPFYIDMINGGGPGRSGPEFEGGGILSLIANALFSPYGSAARERAAQEGGTGMMARDIVRPQSRPRTGVPSPEDIETTILDALMPGRFDRPENPARGRAQSSGVLPTADYEPLRYELPLPGPEYFDTPVPAKDESRRKDAAPALTSLEDIQKMIEAAEADRLRMQAETDRLLGSAQSSASDYGRRAEDFARLAGAARRDPEPGPPSRPGILPDASMEPMGYEPPPVTADYFATPAPIEYPELPTQADLDANYAGQLRRQAASEAQRSAGVLPTAGNEPRMGDYIPAREPYEPPPTLTEQDLITLARAESMGAAPPALIAMFNGIPTGTPLSEQETMILRALRQAAR